jgi:hypothetical protein
MNELETIHTNPFTGEKWKRVITDDGVFSEPPQFSYFNGRNGKGQTNSIRMDLGNDELNKDLLEKLISAAKGLSEMTGKQIEFFYIKDGSCAVWGDFGYFTVTDPVKKQES